MRNSYILIVSLCILSFCNAQQWGGPLNNSSSIYRSGNVAVGINSPLSKLHVNGAIRISGTSPNYGGPTLIFGNSNNKEYEFGKFAIEYLDSGLNFSVPFPNEFFGNYKLFISPKNKIGMGTNNFSCYDCEEYRLFVKNGIRTEKIKVDISADNNWADYVFDENYKLKNLNELRLFIEKNKHLPEIPTTNEVLKNGVELKEMNILLLKKVEELTLYILQLEERISRIENL